MTVPYDQSVNPDAKNYCCYCFPKSNLFELGIIGTVQKILSLVSYKKFERK